MPAMATIEELREVERSVLDFESRFPEAYVEMSRIIKTYRKIGYKNITKLLLHEATPEKLKGG